MKRGLSRFLIASAIVLAGVVVVDVCVGAVMDRILPKIGNAGETGKTYYSMYKVEEPVLIVGSSRASHHYVPQIISDSLGMPVRNIGRDGCFFSYNCCVINSILDRYSPELIIWENGSDYLSEEVRDPLENLYPYYVKNDYVHNCLGSYMSVLERVPLYSSLYRYNSVIHRILMRYASGGEDDDSLMGYLPLKPKEWNVPVRKSDSEKEYHISRTKEQQFVSVLERANAQGVRMVVVDSPIYTKSEQKTESCKRMREICDSLGVLFLDNSGLEGFCGNKEMFNDGVHMNEIGAQKYTQFLIEQCRTNGILEDKSK